RLRRPEVRERRHQRVAGRVRLRGQRADQLYDRALQQWNATPQVQPEIERDLLVARAAGVQAPARVAELGDEQTLDEAVHVLIAAIDERGIAAAALENPAERGFDLTRLAYVENAGLRQRPRPRLAADHVVFEQPPIEAKRCAEVERRGVRRGGEPAGPQR